MATLKHINSKNADYGAAEQYLLFEHDEFTMKPVLDETGRLIPREDYRLSTLNCGGEDFAVACMRANLRYEKNQRREDVKSHHYIISFDPRDGPDNGLTVDRAQALGEQFCKEHFPGHQALVCTHPDNGILVTDRVLGGADTWATSQTIAGAIRNLDYDLIITGRQAIDGDTAQVGPQISEHLGIPVISYAQDIKIDGDSVIVERQFDDRYHVLKAKMPCLITALGELNEPRYMTPGGIFDAFKKEITVWGRADLKDVDDSNLGLKGSPTQIAKASDKVRKGAGEKFTFDAPDEAASFITGKLQEKHII